VEFQAISFTVNELLGISELPILQKILIPQRDKTKTAIPANDVTYLDQNVRIARGGDGSLFIFVREANDNDEEEDGEGQQSTTNQRRQQQQQQGKRTSRSMLTQEEREALIARQEQKRGGPERVNVGIGVAETSSNSPELKFLFQNR
jgi:PAP_fibrillin